MEFVAGLSATMVHDQSRADRAPVPIMVGCALNCAAASSTTTEMVKITLSTMKLLKSILVTLLGCVMLLGFLGAVLQGLPVPAFFFLVGGWVCIPPLRVVVATTRGTRSMWGLVEGATTYQAAARSM